MKFNDELKSVILMAAIILATGTAASTALNNIESITPSGSNPIAITGSLDLQGNNISSFFGDYCPTGEVSVGINDDGTIPCIDVTNEVQNTYVSRAGDSMTGNLDLQNNNLIFSDTESRLKPDQGGSIELGGSNSAGNADGNTPYIDFHYGAGFSQDYNVRLINDGNNTLTVQDASLNLDNDGLNGVDWSSSDDGSGSGLDADTLDGTQLSNINWGDTAMAQSDVNAGDVGLDNVENIALSNSDWNDMAISRTDISSSDVGLGNVENTALSNADWGDMAINQNDVSVSNLGAANTNLNMNGNSIENLESISTRARGVSVGRPLNPESTNSNDEARYWGLLRLEDGWNVESSGVISGERTSFARGTELQFHAESGWDGDNSPNPSDSMVVVSLMSGNADSFTRLVEFSHNGYTWVGIERDPGGCCSYDNIQFSGQSMRGNNPTKAFPKILSPNEVSSVSSYSGPEYGGTGSARFGGKLDMNNEKIVNADVEATEGMKLPVGSDAY